MAREPKAGDTAPMLSEGLLSSGLVRLFGRPFTGLAVGDLGTSPTSNHPIAVSMRSTGAVPTLTRVYGFSYLGNYYKLAEPLVFLVFTAGQPVPAGELGIDVLGIEFKDEDFTEGVLMWAIDQLDMVGADRHSYRLGQGPAAERDEQRHQYDRRRFGAPCGCRRA